MDSVSIIFTQDELWLLHKYIRHEIAGVETMKYPPCGLELNDKITEAILFCYSTENEEASLIINKADVLAIDATVPQDAKTMNGLAIGKNILLKTFQARKELKGEEYNESIETEKTASKQEIEDALALTEEEIED